MDAMQTGSRESAFFETNGCGRILKANKRFCRMFGFEESEIEWHYITDLCRNAKDWDNFSKSEMRPSTIIRMKNRKGRSFCCKLYSRVKLLDDGSVVYSVSVRRLSLRNGNSVPAGDLNEVQVFLARCACCGEQIRVATAGEIRIRRMCHRCSAREYPEIYCIRRASV